MTNFERILEQVPIESNAKVLDVGAGGFAGETTTKHLVNRFDFVVALEQDREFCSKLRLKFSTYKLSVLNTSIEKFEPLYPYDLMVVDLNSSQIPFIKDTLIEFYGKQIVKVGGYIITLWDSTQYLHSLNFVSKLYLPKWEECPYGWLLVERIA